MQNKYTMKLSLITLIEQVTIGKNSKFMKVKN
jgi:hypothetical protein